MKLFHGILAVIASLGLMTTEASAADLATKAPPYVSQAVCTQQNCSGWYIGASISGNSAASSVSIAGINTSIFSGGEILSFQGGYQLWNGTYLFGAEVSIGAQLNSGPLNQFSTNSLVAEEGFKFGGALSGLFGNSAGTTNAGQAPGSLTVPSALSNALIAPYIWLGAVQRAGYNQLTTGAGAEFVLAQGWNLDLRYEYAPALDSLGAFSEVKIGLNYHFNLR